MFCSVYDYINLQEVMTFLYREKYHKRLHLELCLIKFIASTLVIFLNGNTKYSNVHVFWNVRKKCGCILSFKNIGDLQVFIIIHDSIVHRTIL